VLESFSALSATSTLLGEFWAFCLLEKRKNKDADVQNSVLQEYYESHRLSGTSASTISWIGSLQIFFLFAGTLFGGPLFDRYGAVVCTLLIILDVFANLLIWLRL
jgi:MFS family permease